MEQSKNGRIILNGDNSKLQVIYSISVANKEARISKSVSLFAGM